MANKLTIDLQPASTKFKEGDLVPMRDGFGYGLLLASRSNQKIIALSADLTTSVKMNDFAAEFPDRFFNTGIQEQNMAATAAGLALEGFTPFIGSFANFQPGRNFDQIRTSICMMNANVKIVSSHAGFSYGEDGITVQMLEDIAMMRALPNMSVVVPADAAQAAELATQIALTTSPTYLRIGRAETPILPKSSEVKLGKGQLVRDGNDLTIIASGYMVAKALQAAKQIASKGIDVRVINLHTIKPIDSEIILKAAKETKAILTVEEHQIAGGMGSAVLECLANHAVNSSVKLMGVNDQFGETGTSEELLESRGLTVGNIIRDLQSLI